MPAQNAPHFFQAAFDQAAHHAEQATQYVREAVNPNVQAYDPEQYADVRLQAAEAEASIALVYAKLAQAFNP